MPDLFQSLQNHDLAFLSIVAGLWGIELEAREPDKAISELSASLLDRELAGEILASLTPQAQSALAALAASNGRVPLASFARQFGSVRDMGAAKRDREKPYLDPASAAEVLFYRALLFRAFFSTDQGPQEFAYIPDDLLKIVTDWQREAQKIPASMIAGNSAPSPEAPGRGATPGEKKHLLPANDRILDDATSVLAALRLGRQYQAEPRLMALLKAAGLFAGDSRMANSRSQNDRKAGAGIKADKAKAFLEASRRDALKMLVDAWRKSETVNELRLLPGLLFEGEWKNQPLVTREFILDLLHSIPEGAWWSLNAFVSGVKKTYPDFQRPAGDYDSWFIKRAADGTYLRGFAYWDQVDGALIRFFITEVLYGLGMVELAAAEEGGPVTAFHLLAAPSWKAEETGKITVASDGKIAVPRLVPRAVRYQLSRFCEWDEEKPEAYRYHITPQSLTKGREQGLKVEHLLALLGKHAGAGVPPVLLKALKRWDANGTEARAETQVILKVTRPEVLEELRNSKAARFLGEPLGPTSIVIKAGAQAKVMAALAELGLLAEDKTGASS
ncbi:MAG TPA: helicase-associated domain-containing protein [Anaerolineales bacterium]